jgi:hypothetical protein
MLFVPVDVKEGSFEMAWLVSSAEFVEGAQRSGDRLRFAGSLKVASKDKWSYKVSRASLPQRILAVLAALDDE